MRSWPRDDPMDTDRDAGRAMTGHVELPLAEAAERLGISTAAMRKRLKRGKSIRGYQREGRWYVLIPEDAGPDTDTPTGRTRVEDVLQDRIDSLERELAARRESEHELRLIIARLSERVPELTAGPERHERAGQDESPADRRATPQGRTERVWWKFWERD